MLDTIEMREKAKREDRELRLAMLASGNWKLEELFDEFKDVETDDSAEIEDDVDIRWDFSNAQLNRSQDEVEGEIQAMLAAAAEGSSTLEVPQYGDWQ